MKLYRENKVNHSLAVYRYDDAHLLLYERFFSG